MKREAEKSKVVRQNLIASLAGLHDTVVYGSKGLDSIKDSGLVVPTLHPCDKTLMLRVQQITEGDRKGLGGGEYRTLKYCSPQTFILLLSTQHGWYKGTRHEQRCSDNHS